MFYLVLPFITVLAVTVYASTNETTTLNGHSKYSKLGSYKVNHVSVSGLSSGGYFAVQFHVAHSSIINGAAIFAAGPFYCAESNLVNAENRCMKDLFGGPPVSTLVGLTNSDYALGLIDDPSNLEDDRVYIFSGKDDTVVDQSVVKSLQSYYSTFLKASNIISDYNIQAEHCFPTLSHGEDCSTLASPYIGNCNFDGALKALESIYGTSLQTGSAVPANLIAFDQTPFFSSSRSSIGDVGYIYVPTSCQGGKVTCKLHVSFHGCLQNIDAIGNAYASDTGFNGYAEANGIIILYPYVKASTINPYNPNGCWDWWAYTNEYYGVKTGVQMQFVRKLVQTVAGF